MNLFLLYFYSCNYSQNHVAVHGVWEWKKRSYLFPFCKFNFALRWTCTSSWPARYAGCTKDWIWRTVSDGPHRFPAIQNRSAWTVIGLASPAGPPRTGQDRSNPKILSLLQARASSGSQKSFWHYAAPPAVYAIVFMGTRIVPVRCYG
jgi:hypothetical protein